MDRDNHGIQRRVAGDHDMRLDGMRDIIWRAPGRSVFDVGCNRGMVGVDFARAGARAVNGCDNYALGIQTAREIFADMRWVSSQFEVVDLTEGPKALEKAFGRPGYDIVVCLATIHKLRRVMKQPDLEDLVTFLLRWTRRHFVWRGTSAQVEENAWEMDMIDRLARDLPLIRTHTSYLSSDLGPCAIWSCV